jgi:uncharacterized protein YggE
MNENRPLPVVALFAAVALVAVLIGAAFALGEPRTGPVTVLAPAGSGASTGITVNGTATLTVVPDMALLDLGITATAQNATSARADMARSANAVIEALASIGIAGSDVATTALNLTRVNPGTVYPQPLCYPASSGAGDGSTGSGSGSISGGGSGAVGDSSGSSSSGGSAIGGSITVGPAETLPVPPVPATTPVTPAVPGTLTPGIAPAPTATPLPNPAPSPVTTTPVGPTIMPICPLRPVLLGSWQASETLEVTIHQLDTTGPAIDAAVAAGATDIFGLSFDRSDRAALEAQARVAAIKDAHDRAAAEANAAGSRLGPVLSISDTNYVGGPIFAAPAAAGTNTGTTVSPGNLTISATLTASWALQP